MRKHISSSIQIVLALFLALVASLTARAQTPPALNGYSAAVLNYNPLGYWPLTETVAPPSTPPVANNLVGVAQGTGNGQYIGGVYPGQTGPLANGSVTSPFFDRSTGEVVVPYSSALTQSGQMGVTGSFTAECWINQQFTNSTAEYVLGYGNFGNTAANPTVGYSGFRFEIVSGRVEVQLYDTNGTTASVTLENASTYLLQPATWYHVAFVFSNDFPGQGKTTNLFIFTNGVLATSVSVTTANTQGLTFVPDDGSGVPGTTIGTTFTVGCYPNQEGYFQGNIAQVALYPSALTSTVLASHYATGINPSAAAGSYATLVEAANPLVYLPLNESGTGYAYPVATNYATTGSGVGAAGNGYYLMGTSPGGATGPVALGSPQVVNFPPSTERTSWGLTPETGRALTVGAHVDIAPMNDLLLNVNTNFTGGTANTNTTVLAWVQVPSGPVPWFQRLMGRNDGSSWRLNVNQGFWPNTNGFPGYPDFVDGSPDNVGPTAINDGQWHFWAASYNETNFTETLYIDGVFASSSLVTTAPAYANTSPLTIGGGATSTTDDGGNFANGNICGVAVYNSALSQAQIQAIFNSTYSGIVTQPPATVNYATGPITISAVVQGPVIQWYQGTPGVGTPTALVNSSTVSGATTESLTLNPPSIFGNYFVVVGDGMGNFQTSSVVTLNQLTVSGSFVTSVQALNPVGFWLLNEPPGSTVAYNWGSLGAAANGVYTTDPNGSSTYTQQGATLPTYANLPSELGLALGTTEGTDMAGGAGVFVENQPGLELGSSNALTHVARPVSMAAWIQVPSGTVGWFQSVIGKGDNSFRFDEERPNAGWNADTSSDLQSIFSLADGQWHFWVGTCNGTNLQTIYIDGLPAGSNTVSINTGGNSHLLDIGGAPDYVGRNFAGNIADVAVFNYALSPSQALQLWNTMYSPNVTVPANVYYASGTGATTITAHAQGPYQQWYFGTPGSGTPVFNSASISGAGTTLGSALPILTFIASGSPLSLPAGDYGTYYLVVGDNNGNFVTSSVVTLAPITLGGVYDNAVLALNPIAYWPLNETSGTIAYNYTPGLGAAINGTYQNNTTVPTVQGVPGPAAAGFGGTDVAASFGLVSPGPGNDLVGANYCGTANNLTGTPSGTGVTILSSNLMIRTNESIAMWGLLPNGLNTQGNQGYAYGQQNSANGTMAFLGATGGGGIYWSMGGNAYQGSQNYGDATWHFWVATYNATNQTTSNYIDGVYVAGTAKVQNGVLTNNPANVTTTIGSDSPGGFTRNWNGDICRVAVFTNCLTPAQILSLYSVASMPPTFVVQPPPTAFAVAGSVATLGDVTVSGSPTITYQWYSGTPGSGIALVAGPRYPAGVTSASLVIDPVVAGDAGNYYVEAINTAASVPSSAEALTVNTAVPAEVYAGGSPTFSVAPGSTTYAWYTNGVLDTTATSSTYTLHSVTAAANNTETVYAVLNGTGQSATWTLNVLAAPTDPYPLAVMADHPLAYYRLDEQPDNGAGNNGTVLHDYINANNGVYTNTVLAGTGFPYGSPLAANADPAAQFGSYATSNSFAGFIPGIDFGLAASNSPTQLGNGEFSVEAWVYGVQQPNHGIVTKGYGGGNQTAPYGEQFSLQTSAGGGSYEFLVNDAADDTVNLTYVVSANTLSSDFVTPLWYHLVGVCDQTNGYIYLYKNGLLAGESALLAGKGILSAPTTPLSIGAKQQKSPAGNYTGQFVGTIDEVAIYNTALTSNQVQSHYFAAGIAPIFLIQPTSDPNIGNFGNNTNAGLGSSVTLRCLGYGSPALHYQWYDYNSGAPTAVNGAAEPGNTGATTPTLTLKNVSSIAAGGTANTIGSGVFFVAVYNAYGSNGSALVTIIPVDTPVSISPDLPPKTYALLGQSAVFAVGENGEFPITNAWYYNNGTSTVKLSDGGRISGSATATLTIANVTTADQGSYQVFATNAASYPSSSSSTASALVVLNEPTFFNNGEGWTLNSAAGTTLLPSIANNVLEITQNTGGQANSFFYDTPMYCGAFQASFTYQMPAFTTSPADGFTFCLQNDPAGVNALGGGGGALGYSDVENGTTPYITNSLAVGFDLYNGHTRGWEVISEGYSAYAYTSYAPVSLISGDQIGVSINYDGNTITVGLADSSAGTTYTNSQVIGPISQYVGGNTALIGFTGGTGGDESQQNISSFLYTPIPLVSAALSGNNVVISWPSGAGMDPYVLQSCTTVNGIYTTVPGTPPIVNGNYQVSVPIPQGAGDTFYRLYLANP